MLKSKLVYFWFCSVLFIANEESNIKHTNNFIGQVPNVLRPLYFFQGMIYQFNKFIPIAYKYIEPEKENIVDCT